MLKPIDILYEPLLKAGDYESHLTYHSILGSGQAGPFVTVVIMPLWSSWTTDSPVPPHSRRSPSGFAGAHKYTPALDQPSPVSERCVCNVCTCMWRGERLKRMKQDSHILYDLFGGHVIRFSEICFLLLNVCVYNTCVPAFSSAMCASSDE